MTTFGLVHTRLVARMPQRGIASNCSFDVFAVIKSVSILLGVLHKCNDYGSVLMLMSPASRFRDESQNSKCLQDAP